MDDQSTRTQAPRPSWQFSGRRGGAAASHEATSGALPPQVRHVVDELTRERARAQAAASAMPSSATPPSTERRHVARPAHDALDRIARQPTLLPTEQRDVQPQVADQIDTHEGAPSEPRRRGVRRILGLRRRSRTTDRRPDATNPVAGVEAAEAEEAPSNITPDPAPVEPTPEHVSDSSSSPQLIEDEPVADGHAGAEATPPAEHEIAVVDDSTTTSSEEPAAPAELHFAAAHADGSHAAQIIGLDPVASELTAPATAASSDAPVDQPSEDPETDERPPAHAWQPRAQTTSRDARRRVRRSRPERSAPAETGAPDAITRLDAPLHVPRRTADGDAGARFARQRSRARRGELEAILGDLRTFVETTGSRR